MDKKELARKKLIENITKVPGWGIPSGMLQAGVLPGGEVGTLKDPDPSPKAGKSINWIDRNDFKGRPAREVYQQELEDFGDGVYLDGKTGNALQSFMRSNVFQKHMVSDKSADGSTRWSYRPPVTNILAGGIDDSYHLKGQAVDIKHRQSWGANSIPDLQDIVIQALQRGFRGIGFGGQQFHFDTRQGGFMGYVYTSWNLTIKGRPVTPSWILASVLCDMDGLRTAVDLYRNEDGTAKYTQDEIVGQIIRTVDPILDAKTGFTGESPLMSDSHIRQFIDPIRGEGSVIRDDKPQQVSLGTVGGLTALAALIIGGVYGFRRFLKHRREQAEAQKIAMDQKKRVIISRFRSKNARLIKKAKSDPEIAARLEQELRAEFELFGIDVD